MSIKECAWSLPSGTLKAFYNYNEEKEKYKLDKFVLITGNHEEEIPLSKIWINNAPTNHLKKFKSLLLDDSIVSTEKGIYHIKNPQLFQSCEIIAHEKESHSLKVPQNLTIIGLKKILVDHLGFSPHIRIKFEGDFLDESNTLAECEISNGATVEIEYPNPEKQEAKEKLDAEALECATFSFVDPSKKKHVEFATDRSKIPSWHSVGRGLNLKGTCNTQGCDAFKQIVYIPRNFGSFSMSEEIAEATCPKCQKQDVVGVTNFLFWDCLYDIEGKKVNKEKFSLLEKAPADKCVTFEEIVDANSKITDWLYLKVTTKKVP